MVSGAFSVGAFYLLSSATFPWLASTLTRHSPDLVPLVFPLLGIVGPLVLALPVVLACSRVARDEGIRAQDRGRAAAAGSGIGATLVAAVSLGWATWTMGSVEGIVLLLPFFVSAALGVGLVGAASFARVPTPGSDARPAEGAPALYQGLTAAGLGILGILAAGPLWAMLASLVPFLSPAYLFAVVGIVGTAALTLGSLAPVSYGVGRLLPRLFHRPRRRVLGHGLLAAALLPALVYGVLATFFGAPLARPLLLTGLGFALGALPHALGIHLALRPPRRPALPAGDDDEPALPPGGDEPTG